MEKVNQRVELQVLETAFERRIHNFAIVNKEHIDIAEFLNDSFDIYQTELKRNLEEYNMVKSMSILVAEYEKKIYPTNNNEQDDNHVRESEQTDNAEQNENNVRESEQVENTEQEGDSMQVESSEQSKNDVCESEQNDSDSSDEDEYDVIKHTVYFSTKNRLISFGMNLHEHYQKNIVDQIMKAEEHAAMEGSGFTLSKIIRLDVQVNKYEPLKGSSYIPTPEKLKKKRALINVVNEYDEYCFKYAVLSALHPEVSKPDRVVSYYEFENELNFDGIDFPVRLEDIDKFVRQNENISINVYCYEEGGGKKKKDYVRPLRVSTEVKQHHIHLLLLIKEDGDPSKYEKTIENKVLKMVNNDRVQMHYCWIKHFSRLISDQLSNHQHKYHICDRCLNYFGSEIKLAKHLARCTNDCQIEMPNENEKTIRFTDFNHQLKMPFVIYADCESYLKELNEDEQKQIFSEECQTKAYQEHIIYSIGYYFKCEFDDSKSYYASSGNRTDCLQWFVEELETISIYVASVLSVNKPMLELTDAEERARNDPEAKCSICRLGFDANETRANDHCHLTGKFRGVAHVKCNLNYQDSRTVPVVMHNLSGYDSHLIIRQLSNGINGDITIIPFNAEQYISFTKTVWNSTQDTNMKEKIKLKFIDSCRFMSESLSKLASYIPSHKKRILHNVCQRDYSTEQIEMLERKGVFPYEYVNSISKLSETSLPPIEAFYSRLCGEKISPEEYEFACEVWDKFQIKTLGEYSELYLKTDVLLLADIFENFRETCHKIYQLEPTQFHTAPGLSWSALLKFTGIELELITDVDMLTFVEKGIRGGISNVSKRHVKANNKYMGAEYNPDQPTNYLMYLDGEFIHINTLSVVINVNILSFSKQFVWSCDVPTFTNR